MNSEDTLYGRIKNGVLALSGNNASIRVDGGYLVVSDGPTPVSPDYCGPAPPLELRMVTGRFRRASCPINRIVVTRPDGFITFAAIKWLHGVGAGLVQLRLGRYRLARYCPDRQRSASVASRSGVGRREWTWSRHY
jgi:hypothetical protein